jgi:integrase
MKLNIRKEGKREGTRYVLDWKPEGGKRKRRFFKSRADAERAADEERKIARKAGEGWLALTTAERTDLVTGYDRIRQLDVTLNQMIDQWLAGKGNGNGNGNGNGGLQVTLEKAGREWVAMLKSRGNSEIHVGNSDRWIRRFARGRETQPVSSVTRQDIVSWLSQFQRHTYNNHRDAARSFFGYCHDQKYCQEFLLKGIPKQKIKYSEVTIFTPDQMQSALQFITTQARELLGYFVLGTYCGIRPEELNRMDWSMVNVDEGLIHLPAWITKVDRPRIIHMHATAVAWVRLAQEWGCKIGADFASGKYSELAPLRTHLGWEEWPHDVMRHSFGSYYSSLVRDHAMTASEMGNSVVIVLKHYLQPVKPQHCEMFWSLTPDKFNV